MTSARLRVPTRFRAASAGIVLLAGALALSACGSSKSSSGLLAQVKKAGTIDIPTDASYAPNEFVQNGQIVGFDVDLGNAIAKQLGVKAHFVNVPFNNILIAMKSGKYNMSLSSFTDEKSREANFDFVDYYSAGESLMVPKGNPQGLKPQDVSLCGKKIAVESGTTEETEVKAGGDQQKMCKQAGKPDPVVLSFQDQDQANLALSTARAQAVLADSPVIAYQLKLFPEKFELAGSAYNNSPYGICLPKKTDLTDAVLKAVKTLVSNGTYSSIAGKWGVQSGDLTADQVKVNGATS